MENCILQTQDITKIFKVGNGEDFYALRNVNIDIPENKLTILKGRSGSGKTTLLNMLSALDMPTKGEVFFQGQDIVSLSEAERESLRRYHMGFVFQAVALIPMMTAYENVEYALRLAKYKGNRDERVKSCLKKVGLADRMYHMPSELSGGEQQRVAIARAIAHEPSVIFADEPTAELDTNTALRVIRIFKDLVEEENCTVVMTTHSVDLMELADELYEMEDGEIL